MAHGNDTRWLVLFCVGMALTAFCGFLTWFTFAMITLKMNPSLHGGEYWRDVFGRMSTNPGMSVLLLVSGAGALTGIVLMSRSGLKMRGCHNDAGHASDYRSG
jgi:hypothetical protein